MFNYQFNKNMAGYEDTRQMIINTLTNRLAGTEIQPEDHQEFALAITDYVRSVELLSGNAFIGFAEANTAPVQSDKGQCFYISTVGPGQTVDFVNFIDSNGNAISVSSPDGKMSLVTLIWNTQYWSSQVTTIDTNWSIAQQSGDSESMVMSQKAVTDAIAEAINKLITTDRIEDGAVTIGKLEPSIQSLITNISKNASFAGIATPTTNPGTPDGPVFYLATEAGTYANFNGISVADGEVVILQWNNDAWTKKTTGLATEQETIYDVSARNGGAVFESLQALLSSSNLSTLIPTSVRHGGMSIRFVQSSDNKYVQYRLMSATWSTTVANWQGVDDEPTAGSDNLVKSGGVYSGLISKNQTAFTDGVVRVGSYNANQFIKEIYIEGWDGSYELVFRYFGLEVHDNIEDVNIYICKVIDGVWTDVLMAFRKPRTNIVKLSERNSSGLTGYIAIDYNFIDVDVPFNKDQSSVKCPHITKASMSLFNCPAIKESFNNIVDTNTNSSSDIASTKLSWNNFVQNKINNNQNIFTTWETANKLALESMILSLKISSDNYDTDDYRDEYYNGLIFSEYHYNSSGNYIILFFKNPANSWVSYNVKIPISTGITTHNYTYGYYEIELIINWDCLVKTNINGLNAVLSDNYKKKSNIIKQEISKVVPDSCILYNTLYNHFNVKDNNIDSIFTTKTGFITENTDNGLYIIAEGYNESYVLQTPYMSNFTFKYGHKYALYYDLTLDADYALNNSSDVFTFEVFKYTQLLLLNINVESQYVPINQRIRGISFATIKANRGTEISNCAIKFTKYNNTKTTDKILGVTFHNLMLVDVTELQNKDDLYFRSLFDKTGWFDKVVISNYLSNYIHNQLYEGLKLRSLGDSLPETRSFQPYVANAVGMLYDSEEEVTTEEIQWNDETVTKWRSVWGSTRVAPLITSTTNDRFMAGASIYMRAKSLKYSAPDVLLILAGYNDTKAGSSYIKGGTAVQPDDYGLNDEPYLGDEIDLVSNPTLAEVPSFGACYRGMVENILKDIPYCRIILCGIPRGSGEAGKYGTEQDWNSKKNAVIERIAKEYGLPFVNLADLYGVNKYNVAWLTKDKLHFSAFGGRRVAMEIIAKAF